MKINNIELLPWYHVPNLGYFRRSALHPDFAVIGLYGRHRNKLNLPINFDGTFTVIFWDELQFLQDIDPSIDVISGTPDQAMEIVDNFIIRMDRIKVFL